MKTLKVILGAAALALISSNVFAADSTPVPRASSSATQTPAAAATPVKIVKKNVGASANFMSFFAQSTCSVDPASIAIASSALYTCSVPGAVVGDGVSISIKPADVIDAYPWLDRDCWAVQAAWVSAADTVSYRIVNRNTSSSGVATSAGGPCDPPVLTVVTTVTRGNPKAD